MDLKTCILCGVRTTVSGNRIVCTNHRCAAPTYLFAETDVFCPRGMIETRPVVGVDMGIGEITTIHYPPRERTTVRHRCEVCNITYRISASPSGLWLCFEHRNHPDGFALGDPCPCAECTERAQRPRTALARKGNPTCLRCGHNDGDHSSVDDACPISRRCEGTCWHATDTFKLAWERGDRVRPTAEAIRLYSSPDHHTHGSPATVVESPCTQCPKERGGGVADCVLVRHDRFRATNGLVHWGASNLELVCGKPMHSKNNSLVCDQGRSHKGRHMDNGSSWPNHD